MISKSNKNKNCLKSRKKKNKKIRNPIYSCCTEARISKNQNVNDKKKKKIFFGCVSSKKQS